LDQLPRLVANAEHARKRHEGRRPIGGTLPVASFYASGPQMIKMLPILKLGQKDTETLTKLFGKVQKLDADLVLDGDVLRIRARTPIR